MSGFSNAIIGGAEKLIRKAIKSPNYQAGTLGWSINQDGSAEFNALTVRGQIIVQSSTQGIFLYSGTPAAGNLVASIASTVGVDPYGNNYKSGIVSYKTGGTSRVQTDNGVLTFHDDTYAFDATINNHKSSTASDAPALQIAGPSDNPIPITGPIPPWPEIDLNGVSSDGTSGPSISLGGFANGGVPHPTPVNINGDVTVTNGVLRVPNCAGSVSVSFTSLTSFTQAVTFPKPFPTVPAVTTNINYGAAAATRWSSRAFNATTTGFTLFVYGPDSTTTSTWSNVPVQWMAIGT